jgi:threonylcarbamoyladenosine tRNA methylthiotransferase MtaB
MKYFIYTFGCKVNQYESQLISQKFKDGNFEITQEPQSADIIVFNSCTVTASADKECEYLLRKTLKLPQKPKIILTGCFAINKAEKLQKIFPDIEIITDKTKLWTNSNKQIVSKFDKHSRAFVKIQDGCDSFCSYCVIPYVRNTLWSKPESDIVDEISELVKNGYCEIVLTGIHIGRYSGGLSGILEKIISIPLCFRIRISSIELNEIDDKLIELMKTYPDKICRHLHIPLQSGSDNILKKMNRKYFTKDYGEKTKKLLNALPGLALTTDVICGFPGETEKLHRESCDFIDGIPFARLHIFSYSDREGTLSQKFENKVAHGEIKRRAQEFFEIDKIKRHKFLDKNIGAKRKAVSAGKNKALTDNYINAEIAQKKDGIFEVEITDKAKI